MDISSVAIILNNTIKNGGASGIFVLGNSYAAIGITGFGVMEAQPNTIKNNGGTGVVVSDGSYALVAGNTISDNGDFGVAWFRDSSGFTSSNLINNNGLSGIGISRGSTVDLGGGTGTPPIDGANETSQLNGEFGLDCESGSVTGFIGSLDGQLGQINIGGSCINEGLSTRVPARDSIL